MRQQALFRHGWDAARPDRAVTGKVGQFAPGFDAFDVGLASATPDPPMGVVNLVFRDKQHGHWWRDGHVIVWGRLA